MMKRILSIVCFFIAARSSAQQEAAGVALTAMQLWKDSFALPGDKVAKWRYDQGVILKGIEGLWNASGDGKWFRYIQKSMDFYVSDDGAIRGYKKDEYNIDHINNGKLLLLLYRVTGKDKYRKAATRLREQLLTHPRTSEGGFWHKKIYPNQMWLDGLYMGQPFYAEYAALFGEDTAFSDIARQFTLMERHSRDPKTGLLYHGWDESRAQQWADKTTGRSPHVWGRALGWFGMALVDVLDHFPQQHPQRGELVAILNRFAKAVISVQDAKTGLWYDIPNLPAAPKNYHEASASSMLVYTLAKGIRKGFLPPHYVAHAKKGYDGIVKTFIRSEDGGVNLHGTVAVSGLGGKPYRDGSFEYYMSEPVIVNDPKGMGAFINAGVEMQLLATGSLGAGKKVVLDNYFNNEWKKGPAGQPVRWHYTWNDKSNGGFSMLGDIFNRYGAATVMLDRAPTAAALKDAQVYIIVDADTEKETERPNRISDADAAAVGAWVKGGGVLLLMANDAGNTDLQGFNTLSRQFGITFNNDNVNMVQGDAFEQGAVNLPAGGAIFKTAQKAYVKELATLHLQAPAKAVVEQDGKTIMAVSKWGRGIVFAIGDPWLYNEYVDGRKLPPGFQNYEAASDLVQWLLRQAPATKMKSKRK